MFDIETLEVKKETSNVVFFKILKFWTNYEKKIFFILKFKKY